MVEQIINIAPLIVPFEAENTYVLSAAKTKLNQIDVAQVRDIGVKFEEVYDFVFSSSGADVIASVDVHHRSLRINPDPAVKLAIPSFFTSTSNVPAAKLNAFIRLNYNNDIDLDVFYSYPQAAGAVNYDAFFYTVDLAPGTLTPPLPDITDFVHYVVIPLRQDNAQRRYLIVGLSIP